jgi:uroporphyrinogen decarboxylase
VLATLNHQEPDRIPFDLGGTTVTGIHLTAYERLRDHLRLLPIDVRVADTIEQLAVVDPDVSRRLRTDCRRLGSGSPSNYVRIFRDEGKYIAFTDEWGIGWRKPKDGGLYFDMYQHPLSDVESVSDLAGYRWPDPTDPQRFQGLGERAQELCAQGKSVVLAPHCVGPTEMHAFLRGWLQYYTDFHLQPDLVVYIMEQVVELKMAYWERALAEVGDCVDVVMEADDVAGQDRLLISPETYRKFVKPYHSKLFSFIKERTQAKLFLHSCGALREILGDLIDSGVDILNPVQRSAAGMDLYALKREFGRDVVFWGGGVDTQGILDRGTPQEVRDNVRQAIDALAPGGGFVFATVHNIQPNVPPENVMAMWETLDAYGVYG